MGGQYRWTYRSPGPDCRRRVRPRITSRSDRSRSRVVDGACLHFGFWRPDQGWTWPRPCWTSHPVHAAHRARTRPPRDTRRPPNYARCVVADDNDGSCRRSSLVPRRVPARSGAKPSLPSRAPSSTRRRGAADPRVNGRPDGKRDVTSADLNTTRADDRTIRRRGAREECMTPNQECARLAAQVMWVEFGFARAVRTKHRGRP